MLNSIENRLIIQLIILSVEFPAFTLVPRSKLSGRLNDSHTGGCHNAIESRKDSLQLIQKPGSIEKNRIIA